MNICGCLLHATPDRSDTLAQELEAMAGVEVHGRSDDGRFVVVVEDIVDRSASEIIMALHQIPGVVSLTLNYHHFEDTGSRTRPDPHDLVPAGAQTHDSI